MNISLYERLLDLAQMLGAIEGHWTMGGLAKGNIDARDQILENYTPEEVAEANRILEKQLSWS